MPILARDILEAHVVSVEPSLPARELEKLLDRERISGAPGLEAGRLVGVVSRAEHLCVRDLMQTELVTVPPEAPIAKLTET